MDDSSKANISLQALQSMEITEFSSTDDCNRTTSHNGKIFVSRKKLIAFVFVSVAVVFATGILGAFYGRSRVNEIGISVDGRLSSRSTRSPRTTTETTPSKRPWLNHRLPKWIYPLHYNLLIRVNISKRIFNGSVDIQIESTRNSRYVLFHSVGMNIRSVKIYYSDNSEAAVKKYFLYPENSFCVIEMKQYLIAGLAFIRIVFDAAMSDTLYGLYHTNYLEPNNTIGEMATTFFAPVAARTTFPCFDEPALKANFTVSLIHRNDYGALSNMPLSNVSKLPHGNTITRFQTSVKMSTYLLCFVVSKFACTETTTENGIKIRVWAPKHLLNQTHYALEAANHSLTYFEKLFEIRYPIPKLDMIALPMFMAGAMENWGLITYRSTRLLIIHHSSTRRGRRNLISIVAHELAHQWFGNLVTMDWWNDVWLNEGFASYIQYLGANSFEPSMNLMEQFLLLDLHPVMQLDSFITSHPLSMQVETVSSINRIFDTITYNKGASIVRMIKEFLGEETFLKGIKNYLRKYAYKNTKQDNLWRELRKVSNIDIKGIMDTWTLQLGYPYIQITRIDSKRVKLKQSHFLLEQSKSASKKSPFNYTWKIPLTYIREKDRTVRSVVMEAKESILDIPNDGWYKLNNDFTGYFRVLYDSGNWKKLTAQMRSNHTVFSTLNRANIISDVFNMAHAGKVTYRTALDSVKYFKKEKKWVAWKTGIDSVAKMNRMLPKTCSTKKKLKRYLDSLVSPIIESLGFRKQKETANAYFQSAAINIARSVGNKNITSLALKHFNDWMKRKKPVPSSMADIVFSIGVEKGDKEEWNFVYQEYKTTTNIVNKNLLLIALGATTSPWLLERFLDYSLNDTKIPQEDGTKAIIAAAEASSNNRFITWNFVRANWDKLMRKYGDGIFLLGRMIKALLRGFSNQYELDMVQAFFKRKTNLGSAKNAVKQGIKIIEDNIRWRKLHEEDVNTWLEEELATKNYKL